MAIKVMARVWAQSSRKDGELLVMLALADFANDAGESWPSLEKLAEKVRITVGQLTRVLKKLEGAGEIRRKRSKGGNNQRTRYWITIPENSCMDTTVAQTQRLKNNSVLHARKTLAPVQDAINRHRTVNKERVKDEPSPSFNGFTKGNGTSESTLEESFTHFWKSYPIKRGKGTALRAWQRLRPNGDLQAKILAAIEAQIRWREARAGDSNLFTPEWKHPATWLKAMGWEDQVEDGRENLKVGILFRCNRCGTSHPDGEHIK